MKIPSPFPRFILWLFVYFIDFILDVIPRKKKDIILWNAIFDWKYTEKFELLKED